MALHNRMIAMIAMIGVALLSAPAAAESDTEVVQRVFTEYRSAILAGQGDQAAALLSQSTYDYYDEMRKLALFGDSSTVQAQSLVNQMQVLMYRLRVPTENLEALSPPGLIAHAVEQGWIGKNSVLKLLPGKVLSEGDVAVLHVMIDEQDAGPAFRFNRESGSWRLDLVPTTQASNVALQMQAKSAGVSEQDFMLVLMESVLGRKLGAEAWEPPRERPRL